MKRKKFRKLVHDHAMTARMSQKYHADLAKSRTSRDQWAKFTLTAMTATVVVTSVAASDKVWITAVAVVAAVTSALITAFNFAERARHHTELKGEWVALRYDAQKLLRRADLTPKGEDVGEDLQRELEGIEEHRARIQGKEGHTNEVLMIQCYNKVMSETGHPESRIPLLPSYVRLWRRVFRSSLDHYRAIPGEGKTPKALPAPEQA